MYIHSIPYTRHQKVCIKYIISGYLNSAAQNDRASRAVLPRGEAIQNLLCTFHHLLTTKGIVNTNLFFLNLAERNRHL